MNTVMELKIQKEKW